MPALGPYTAALEQMLANNDILPIGRRRSVTALYRELRDQHGYGGGYSAVRRYCLALQEVELRIEIGVTDVPIATEWETIITMTQRKRVYRLAPHKRGNNRTPLGRLAIVMRRDLKMERHRAAFDWMHALQQRPQDNALVDSTLAALPDHQKLLEKLHSERAIIRNRVLTICAHAYGVAQTDIAEFLGISRASCRKYQRIFEAGGADALLTPEIRSSRKFDQEDLKKAVFRLLHEPPSMHGINRTSWIMRDLRCALAGQGHEACQQVISRIINDAGWRWRKARVVLTSQDPAYRQKLAAVQAILSDLRPDEAFFSIDEFGPFAVKMKQGLKLDPPGPHREVPQWQKSKGCLIVTAALELQGNQVTHFYSTHKNTTEMIRMMEILLERYADCRKLYLSWDAASWHISKKLRQRIEEHNAKAAVKGAPQVETVPLPAGAQFLNVIESIFSGMARAVIHNSDYVTADAAKDAINRYFLERNQHFRDEPQRAGKRIWGEERVPPSFSDDNNCKDPRWR